MRQTILGWEESMCGGTCMLSGASWTCTNVISHPGIQITPCSWLLQPHTGRSQTRREGEARGDWDVLGGQLRLRPQTLPLGKGWACGLQGGSHK